MSESQFSPRYNHLLVDWDGTIQQTLATWEQACKISLAKRGIDLDREEITRRIIPHLPVASEYGVSDLDQFIMEILTFVQQPLLTAPFDDELWLVLEQLQQLGIEQAVVTSANRNLIEAAALKQAKSLQQFLCLITRESVTSTKPDPMSLLLAIDNLAADKNRTLMIGDSPADIQAAQNAHVDSIWYYPPQNQNFYNEAAIRDQYKPTYTAHTAAEIYSIVTTV